MKTRKSEKTFEMVCRILVILGFILCYPLGFYTEYGILDIANMETKMLLYWFFPLFLKGAAIIIIGGILSICAIALLALLFSPLYWAVTKK